MAEFTAQTTTGRSPLEAGVDRIWRFFCSVRAAVFEIIVLALLVLVGTLRGSDVPHGIGQMIPAVQPIVDRWYAWDVFHSLPFIAVLTLIAIAIAVCTVNRVPGIWQAISHPTVRTTHSFLRGAETAATFTSRDDPARLSATIVETLRARKLRVITEQVGPETHLYADRNRYGKLGTFPFHLALILILVGGIVGARYGFRDTEFIVPEGSIRDVGHGTGLSVELERFADSYSELGIAQDYRSDVVVYDDSDQVERGSITVNNPLTHGSTTFYQSSFGNAAELRITDAAGTLLYADSVDLGIYQLRANPDAPAGTLRLPLAGTQLTLVAPDTDPVNAPALDQLRLASGQLWIQASPLGLAADAQSPTAVVSQGQAARVGDLTVQFVRERRFTVLQVAYNPGLPIFYLASFLLVGGLAITFYFPLRRIRGIVAPAASGATLELAPLAR
ncbi:MAG: cytochrome c biogenesis protein ResB, partial [Chloroflexia bacterium]|nr:cytochrome c biogenesis protein ResB [Chloroflexia bacterium]